MLTDMKSFSIFHFPVLNSQFSLSMPIHHTVFSGLKDRLATLHVPFTSLPVFELGSHRLNHNFSHSLSHSNEERRGSMSSTSTSASASASGGRFSVAVVTESLLRQQHPQLSRDLQRVAVSVVVLIDSSAELLDPNEVIYRYIIDTGNYRVILNQNIGINLYDNVRNIIICRLGTTIVQNSYAI
jgi:hypothetical protein